MYDGAVDGERFLSFLENHLVPKLTPGDVVIMDNCRTHHINPIEDLQGYFTHARYLFEGVQF